MSVEQIEATIESMSAADRRRFAAWFDQHRHKLLGETEKISPAVRDELALRLKEIDEHPEVLVTFEEKDLERMIQETADAHAKKPPAHRR